MSKKLLMTLLVIAGLVAGNAMAQVPLDPATVTTGHVYLLENVGTNVPDDSANNHTGNILGDPVVVDTPNGKGLQLDGVDDGVHLPDTANINTATHQNHTVIAIFNCADVTKSEYQCVYEEGGTTRGLTIYVHEGLVYAGAWNRADYTPQWAPGTWFSAPIGSNEWHTVSAVVRNGGPGQEDNRFEMWMDGELIGKGPGAELRSRADDIGIGVVQGQVIFNDLNENTGHWFGGIIEEVWILNDALGDLAQAFSPVPADGTSDLPLDGVVLAWKGGFGVVSHDVYLNNELISQGQSETTLQLAQLDFGATYEWRVDGNKADGTTTEGALWSFEAEPLAYLVTNITATGDSLDPVTQGPENLVNGSGLADGLHDSGEANMWQSNAAVPLPAVLIFAFDRAYVLHEMTIWNHSTDVEFLLGVGAKDVTIEVGDANDGPWTLVMDAVLNGATAAPAAASDVIDMQGLMASHVRLTLKSQQGFSPSVGLAEVQFSWIPVRAREMAPADGATSAGLDATLSWRAGRGSVEHQVLIDGALAGTPTDPSYDTSLDYGQEITWQVVEVDADGNAYDGPIQSLSAPLRGVIADLDDVVYDNTAAAATEVVTAFDPALDLTRGNPDKLGVSFRSGDPNNMAAQFFVTLTDTAGNSKKVEAAEDSTLLTAWTVLPVVLSDLGDVDGSSIASITLGVQGDGATGVVEVGEAEVVIVTATTVPVDPDHHLVLYLPLDGDASDASGNGLHGTIMLGDPNGEPNFVDGALAFSGADLVNIDGYKGITATDPATGDLTGVNGAFSVALWINTTANNGALVTWGSSNGAGPGGQRQSWRINGGSLRAEHGNGNWRGNTRINDGEWHHVALTAVEGANLTPPNNQLYVDGLPDTFRAQGNMQNIYNLRADADVALGRSASLENRWYTGLMDDVRIYDRALSAGDVLWLAGGRDQIDLPF